MREGLNKELLARTMLEVRRHADREDGMWNQNTWIRWDRTKPACGTSACFAGWAVLLHGDAAPGEPGGLTTLLRRVPGEAEEVTIRDRAVRLLFGGEGNVDAWEAQVEGFVRVDQLFHEHNTIEDLEVMVEALLEDKPFPYVNYYEGQRYVYLESA